MNRMKLERIALVVIVMAVAACATYSGPNSWSATATERTGFRGAGANANAVSSGGETAVTVAFREAEGMSGTERPWHVHYGSCGNDQGIVGDANIYTPLRPGMDGTATTTARIPMRLASDKTYFINIHKSANELSTIVACGEFTPAGGMSSSVSTTPSSPPSTYGSTSGHGSHGSNKNP